MLPLGSSRFCRGIDTVAVAISVDLSCEKKVVVCLGDDAPGQFLEAFRRRCLMLSEMQGMKLTFSLLAALACADAAVETAGIASLFAMGETRPVDLGVNPGVAINIGSSRAEAVRLA